MLDRNKAFVSHLVREVIGHGNFSLVDELVSPDYVGHSSSPEMNTREGHKQFFIALRNAFPDLELSIEDQIAEGDKVVTRWIARGTHRGEFMGIPPTGKRVVLSGIDIDRVADGKLAECWTVSDDLSLLKQLGVLEAPASA